MEHRHLQNQEYDIIFAGGGTAACVVASRLAEFNKDLSILIIEGGRDSYGLENVIYPALFLENLLPETRSSLTYVSKESEALNGRPSTIQTGGILGGGSSINFMLYSRALLRDFDSWKISGWSGLEMKPILKKLETYHGSGDKEDHGFDGPINISGGTYRVTRAEDDIVRAAETVGIPETKDLQNLEESHACERALRYVSPDGIRQNVSHCYLHPLLRDGKHPNLHLLLESKVVRVIFDEDKCAVGVEYIPSPELHPETVIPKQTVRATRLVILSCGSYGTPAVLERSGVGGSEILKNASVPVVVDLPGVGKNYQDHHGVLIPYYTDLKSEETLDDFRAGLVNKEGAIARRDPIVGWNSVDILMKIRPTEEEVFKLGRSFQSSWEKDYNEPLKPLMLIAPVACFPGDPSVLVKGQYITMVPYQAYPYSQGFIHITGPELENKLDIQVGYLTDPIDFDLKSHVWAYKKTREIMRRTKFCRGEVEELHPKFSRGSKAACKKDWEPFERMSDVEDLEYLEEDDEAIESFLRENIITTWHCLGTAKMAPRESGGVVDPSLNVYGVSGLKVVDLSIAPENVAANTNNTAIAIGEKASEIIIRELISLKV